MIAEPIDITVRDEDFKLDPARAADWMDNSRIKTLFMNALSIMFPPGERFFIDSVLKNRDAVTDPKLLAEVKAFVQQEAYHTREHIAYNRALGSIANTDKLESEVTSHLEFVKKHSPAGTPLLATAALEHFTAIMAHELLRDTPRYMKGAVPEYERMWTWHALEECEHKAVAYDVFRAKTKGKAEIRRVVVMFMTSLTFFRFMAKHFYALMRSQELHTNPVAWVKLLWVAYGNPGILRKIVKPYLKYYALDFHPNDIDDSVELARARELAASWA